MVLRGKDEGAENEVCVLGEVEERVGEAGSRELLLHGCAAVPPELTSLCNLTIQLYSFYTLSFLQVSPWERPTQIRKCNSKEGNGA